MVKINGYYLNCSASLDRTISDCNRSIRYAHYWRKVEWRFRLKRAFKMENNEKRSNEIINSVESHQWILNHYMKTWGKSNFP